MDSQQQIKQVAALIGIMAHPIRLQILVLLIEQGEVNVSSILPRVQAEQSLVSHHLSKMKQGGLIRSVRVGSQVRYSLVDPALLDGLMRFVNR